MFEKFTNFDPSSQLWNLQSSGYGCMELIESSRLAFGVCMGLKLGLMIYMGLNFSSTFLAYARIWPGLMRPIQTGKIVTDVE